MKPTNSTYMDAAMNGLAPTKTDEDEDDAATVTCPRLLPASRVHRKSVSAISPAVGTKRARQWLLII